METLQVKTGKGELYRIHIGTDLFAKIAEHASRYSKALIVMDSNTERLFGDQVKNHVQAATHSFPAGEESKNLEVWEDILAAADRAGLDRDSCIIAFGGGVVGDIAGFAAATYMRGIPVIQVPTTLLAQVDSAIGGKTGVNFGGKKNMVGSFHQPAAVFCDISLLSSLPEREIRSGMAEVIKYGCILDANLFSFLEGNVDAARGLDRQAIQHIVRRSCELKADIIARDTREEDLRRILNFGHTIGHAIEMLTDMTHGECVACGMVAESWIAAREGLLPEREAQRIQDLIESFSLPTSAAADPSAVMERARSDKKNRDEDTYYVLLSRIGKVDGVRPVKDRIAEEALGEVWK